MAQKQGNLLIIDDDAEVLVSARLLLKRSYATIKTERDPKRIPHHLRQGEYDLVLLDMNFHPGQTDGSEGIHWLHEIQKRQPDLPVVMMTAYGHIDMAVLAMKEGAIDFVSKPWENEKLRATVRSAYELGQSRRRVQELEVREKGFKEQLSQSPEGTPLLGKSSAMEQVFATIRKVARTEADVLILGENGTGKELVAREIHQQSLRAGEAFIKVDLGAITESLFESELFGHTKGAFTDAKEDRAGRFEVASGGTLFLDEIGNLSLGLQVKLLSALQNRMITRVGSHQSLPVDIRLICATNMPLYEMVKEQGFRQDLLYRINTVEIPLPPLRKRKDDISLLVDRFLQEYVHKYRRQGLTISKSALKKLKAYHWPGNIRELRHAVERAVILSEGGQIEAEDFVFRTEASSPETAQPASFNLDQMERQLVQQALAHHHGNISQAAKDLGITRAALYRRMEKYGL
ncbi:MAG: sigma-54 dependent transcriptional regulator [Bacteroidota bacterium]